jgi:sugar/nucleoside kinase (ribokinase family)
MIPAAQHQMIVATGGIGSGINLALEGEHTLGREESRAVTLLEGRDYCKLHIVAHYMQRLLGAPFPVIAVGKVGADDAGTVLLRELAAVGLGLDHVAVVPGKSTLYSVSFNYPGGDGGNLTTKHSASDEVGPGDIRAAADDVRAAPGPGIAVALPEVPLAARAELLTLATELGLLRVATFTPGEAPEALASGMLHQVDLLALNIDEARAFTGLDASGASPEEITTEALARLLQLNERLNVVITAGGGGSWSWDGATLVHTPAFPVEVQSTAGAGDSHLAGVIVAIARGATLHEANRFGTLVGAMKVESVHTINPDISPETVLATAKRLGARLPEGLAESLAGIRDPGFSLAD